MPDPARLYLDYNQSVVEWNQRDGSQVGHVTVATIRVSVIINVLWQLN